MPEPYSGAGQRRPFAGASMPYTGSWLRSASNRGADRPSVSGKPLHAPSLAALTGFSRSSSDPLRPALPSQQNHHFGACPSLGFTAIITTCVSLTRNTLAMKAPVDLSRGLCSDQEQPVVEPHCTHTEHEPAGTVGAPQSMQGSMFASTTTISWSALDSICSGVIR